VQPGLAARIGCPTKQADLPIGRRFANPPHKVLQSQRPSRGFLGECERCTHGPRGRPVRHDLVRLHKVNSIALTRETLRATGTGKSGIIFRQRELATIPSPPRLLTAGTNRPPLAGPGTQAKERVGRTTLASVVRDEFRNGYSLIGLLASRARLRFTGARRITCSPQRPRLKGTFLLC
jgi:hypothetical protein